MSRFAPLLLTVAVVAALPAAAVQRAFVASYGSDTNTATGCGFTSPCRGFTAALGVVDSGGEIVALDAAGYGAVVITKSVTITANPGFYAGISASSGDAVFIATTGVKVILRGLNINSVGATYGIRMTDGNRLTVENCVISNFSVAGVHVVGDLIQVRVVDSLLRDNANGVRLENGARGVVSGSKLIGNSDAAAIAYGTAASTTTTLTVTDTTVAGNGIGVVAYSPTAGAISRVHVSRSTVSHNQYGVLTSSGDGPQFATITQSHVTENSIVGLYNYNGNGAFESLGNNLVRHNVANTQGTITTVPGL